MVYGGNIPLVACFLCHPKLPNGTRRFSMIFVYENSIVTSQKMRFHKSIAGQNPYCYLLQSAGKIQFEMMRCIFVSGSDNGLR